MPAIRATNQIAEKWARVTPQRAQDYKAGVTNPKNNWQEQTLAAAEAQAAGVQLALAENRFERGVSEAGNAKWQRKAAGVGSQRFGPGVQAARGDYEQGFAPFAQVIQGTTLPPRGAKGDPRNYDRARQMGEALHNAKTGGGGA